ncbi:30S ribosomal protein S17e [Candidatus Pacearchaeota archaeon]|nr:30S ribosomal protein S17e [Candidatus Pacearchaeota archaeon]
MGRIKSAVMKKTAKQFISENAGLFSADFKGNKQLVKGLIVNKRTRNIVVGYITRLAKTGKEK